MNFFLVESPLQLLNANEAKYKFNIHSEESVLLVFDGVSKRNFAQIKQMVRKSEWQKVYYFKNTQKSLSRYFNLLYLKKVLKTYEKHDRIFIGEYRSDLMRDFIHKSNSSEYFLIDDGNYSLILHNIIRNEEGIRSQLTKKRLLLNKLFGLDDRDLFDIIFFTVYDEKSKEPFIHNNYELIKSKLKSNNLTNKIYFIGNNTPELNIVSEKVYLKSLSEVKKYYKEQIYYIPHRRESLEKIERIKNELGFEVLNFDLPIEWAILTSRELPSEVASFFSSALDNCYLIFGHKIKFKAFRMPVSVISESRKQLFKLNFNRYEQYEENFEIIEL